MSYDILYGKCFVKVSENEFIPIIVSGASNCWENLYNKKQRRERNFSVWSQWSIGDEILPIISSKKQLSEKLNNWEKYNTERNENYRKRGYDTDLDKIDGLFKGGKTITMKEFKTFINNGIKTAKTIEELATDGIYLKMEAFSFDKGTGKNFMPKTTEELKTQLKELELFVAENKGYNIYIDFTMDTEWILQYYRQTNRKNKFDKNSVSVYYIIENTDRQLYYYKGTKRVTRWIHTKEDAQPYKNLKIAEKRIAEIKKRFFSINLIPVKITK